MAHTLNNCHSAAGKYDHRFFCIRVVSVGYKYPWSWASRDPAQGWRPACLPDNRNHVIWLDRVECSVNSYDSEHIIKGTSSNCLCHLRDLNLDSESRYFVSDEKRR